ncbi:hypothetical protein TRVL_00033 [Trypanosoma vivax]|nr:hypothetical protein TRVL_00033 [Trypanosoma vivax]
MKLQLLRDTRRQKALLAVLWDNSICLQASYFLSLVYVCVCVCVFILAWKYASPCLQWSAGLRERSIHQLLAAMSCRLPLHLVLSCCETALLVAVVWPNC